MVKCIGDMLDNYDGKGAGPSAEEAGDTHAKDVCPVCQGKGFLVYDVPAGHPNFSKLMPCRCTQARIANSRMREMRVVSNLGAMDRMTFDTFMAGGIALSEALSFNLREAYERGYRFAQQPEGWLVLLGGYGCGKTHLAAAIANYRILQGQPALFVVVADLLDHLRATYAPTSATSFDERIESIREAPLLILDDLGAHNSTAWAQEKLFQILNHRYNHRLPTVITSNERLEDQDPRILSRLVDIDLSQVYEILAPDFRAGGRSDRGANVLSTLDLHRDQTFEGYSSRAGESLKVVEHESLEQALKIARAFAEDPAGWLVFSGTYGCGKTHLAAAIANYQLTIGGRPRPMFIVVPDLLDHLRATFSPNSPTTLDKLFEQIRTSPLLVLDDLGTESATPWAREKLFQLFNYRYAARLPTVITTYYLLEELDERLASRMRDRTRCIVVGIEAPSYRGSPSQGQNPKRRSRRRT